MPRNVHAIIALDERGNRTTQTAGGFGIRVIVPHAKLKMTRAEVADVIEKALARSLKRRAAHEVSDG